MIVDSSALIAIIKGEPDAARIAKAMVEAPALRMSAANWLEAAMVADGLQDENRRADFDELIAELGIELAAFTPEMAVAARLANQRFGRGTKARLNFGDCMAYALAKLSGEPLLFKGGDFTQIDIEPVLT